MRAREVVEEILDRLTMVAQWLSAAARKVVVCPSLWTGLKSGQTLDRLGCQCQMEGQVRHSTGCVWADGCYDGEPGEAIGGHWTLLTFGRKTSCCYWPVRRSPCTTLNLEWSRAVAGSNIPALSSSVRTAVPARDPPGQVHSRQ